jgi:hypothetical protein
VRNPSRQLAFVLSTLTLGLLFAPPASAQVREATQVVWVGLDFSATRMVGPGDFNDPGEIFPGFLNKWNDLLIAERIDDIEKSLRKTVILDTRGIAEVNATATADQISIQAGPDDSIDATHLDSDDLAAMVGRYTLESDTGIGLVFVVERFVKPAKAGAVQVVFFDIATREVLDSSRTVQKASGFGFRNYWFNVIKRAEKELEKWRGR